MAKESGDMLKKSMKILFGVILILVGLGSYIYWWPQLWALFKRA
jgi:hypothetical protein